MLEKPEPMILYRPINMGGLGLHEIKTKALASLIRTFMEMTVNPDFIHSTYLSLLYRLYVLEDDSVSIQAPPYFSPSFFACIKWVKDNTPLNIGKMTTAQWYRVILEKDITMEIHNDSSNHYIQSRAELAAPTTDWEVSWKRARLRGLESEVKSFFWKLLQLLLPTEQRLSRILPNSSQNCKLCQHPTTGDLEHAMFNCVSTRETGDWVISLARKCDLSATPSKLLRLDFTCEQAEEMPLSWLLGQTMMYMWGVRSCGKNVDPVLTRAVLESKINLLRETRFVNDHTTIR